ncbi:MAG: RuBisCO large subunit C-terminal-like domain-containing protein [Methanocellales archaeon]|nr:RuBisCO large subunit C-terminal-like domain-containing protein [Methanocellales archaeon]MDD4898877.1 RuBisCO large subunit C-terminal-like domain-containing protein [Methanocellales archaeon]MDD5447094.1 RuBisCO large subunit C-terminal-like domain-containing protein [Methanocellales archaeon]
MEFVECTYYVESSLPIERAARAIAAEQSTGTWTDISTKEKEVDERLGARVLEIDGSKVKIEFPIDLFEVDNVPQFLATVAGNLFGLGALKNIRLLDIKLPKSFVREFKGPRFGIEGVRKKVGTVSEGRAHIGTIIKPKVGLSPKETAEVAYNAGTGGCDLIKDDETLTDQTFCPMVERLENVMERIDKIKKESSRTVLYAVNITVGAEEILERADLAMEHGANMLMIDVLTAGFSALKTLRDDGSVNLPIHVHRTMHGAITRNKKHGIAMLPLAVLVRLCGGDQLHTGTATGKMESDIEGVKEINDFLKSDWHDFKTVFPVASGGLHPGLVPYEINAFGKDVVLQAGGGIHGHPDGTTAGAKAMRQAVDAARKNIPLEKYALEHPELMRALEKWGRKVE